MSYYDRDRMGETTRLVAGTMNHAYSHHGNVAEYQVSGIPFFYALTCAANTVHTVTFPYVTQWIQIVVKDSNQTVNVAYEKAGLAHTGGNFVDSTATGGTDTRLLGTNYVTVDSQGAADGNNGHVWRMKTNQLAFIASSTPTVFITAGLTSVPSSEFPSLSGIIGIGAAPTQVDDDGSA